MCYYSVLFIIYYYIIILFIIYLLPRGSDLVLMEQMGASAIPHPN